MGFFNPQLAEQSLTALDLMDFDGEEKVKDKVQQGQTMLNQLAQMQMQMQQMAALLYQRTGIDALGMTQQNMEQPQKVSGGQTMASAQKAAQESTMTSYGEKLAARAKPDMNNA